MRKKGDRRSLRFGTLWLILFVCIGIGAGSCLFQTKEVSAAAVRLTCTDGSGNYLRVKKTGTGYSYYLYDKQKKPLTNVQYIKVPKNSFQISTGFYMFDETGMLIRKQAVYYISKRTVHGVTFQGYYYANTKGCFRSSEYGLVWLGKFQCRKMTYHGYYYLQKYGKLNGKAQCRYIEAKTSHGTSFQAGYYWFTATGKLNQNKMFHSVYTTIQNEKFSGTYYFGAENGRLLVNRAGLRKINGKTYYLTKMGCCLKNCWKGGHYFQANGVMAVNMKTPDGGYVDADGNPIGQAQFEMEPLKAELSEMLKGYSGTWSVYVKNLDTGVSIEINNTPLYAASVIKPFVMEAVFQKIQEGKLKYNTVIKNQMWEMITESSNEAFNRLVEANSTDGTSFLSGASVVNQYIKKKGYTGTQIYHTLPRASSPYADRGKNTVSVRDAGLLLERIYEGTCVSEAYSKEMLRLLLNQTRRWKIPSVLPSGTKIANKTGETEDTQHDIAIVYSPKATYILCVFSNQVNESEGIQGIREVSRKVYEYWNGQESA